MPTIRSRGNQEQIRKLASVPHKALQGAEACVGYALEAETAGNDGLVDFFRDV